MIKVRIVRASRPMRYAETPCSVRVPGPPRMEPTLLGIYPEQVERLTLDEPFSTSTTLPALSPRART